MSKFNRVHFSSQKVTYNTPDGLFDVLHKQYHFNFDPCLPPRIGNFNGNGLREHWKPKHAKGRVFINPPYKKKITNWWVMKGWEEVVDGYAELVVFLLPDRMGTDWATWLVKVGAQFYQMRGRNKFGDAKNSAPFDSLVIVITDKIAKKFLSSY